MYRKCGKRIFDIIISLMILPFFCIIFVIVAPMIHIEDGGEIFFKAERRGFRGKVFKMYKFRSMKMNAPVVIGEDGSVVSTPDDNRITKIGSVLRKTSIDEIPQILNVLKGDMSIIGPRPAMPSKAYSELTKEDKKRLSIRPGITGYSQAYFRNSISQAEKYKNDLYYCDNISFMLDIKIILKTVQSVLGRKNIY